MQAHRCTSSCVGQGLAYTLYARYFNARPGAECIFEQLQELEMMTYYSRRDANIVPFYGACLHDGCLLLVVEYMEVRFVASLPRGFGVWVTGALCMHLWHACADVLAELWAVRTVHSHTLICHLSPRAGLQWSPVSFVGIGHKCMTGFHFHAGR